MSGNKLMDSIRELTPEMLENIVGGVVTLSPIKLKMLCLP